MKNLKRKKIVVNFDKFLHNKSFKVINKNI